MSRVRIIGIGSPFGNDTLGWQVVEKLKQQQISILPSKQIEFIISDRPALNLIPLIQDIDLVILVDAIQSEVSHGQILKLDMTDLVSESVTLSSHKIEVAGALALAEKLDALPKKLCIYGLTINTAQTALLDEISIDKLGAAITRELINHFTETRTSI